MRGGAVRWRAVVAVGGTVLTLIALATAFTWPLIFDAVLAKQLALTPTSRSFHDWRAPEVPIYMEIFLFNWTNAESFPDEMPNLDQVGPYRFREYRRHVNITWHPNNGSLAYRTLRYWTFDSESSNGTLEDQITTLNVIAASAAFRVRNKNSFHQTAVSGALAWHKEELFVSKPAGELLFEGYEDPLLYWAKFLPESMTGNVPKLDRFGFFYGRNNSIDSDGHMEVTTGVEKGTLPGQVLRWNYEDHIPYYSGRCSEILGSAGEFLPRNLTEESALTMFIPDLCRTVHMEHTESGELDGLPYLKYEIAESSFDNSTGSEANTCFCNGECAWSGVMNVSACRYDSPAFISLPHFLYGDPRLRTMVTGLDPDPEKHSFYFAVEPNFGVPLDVAARFQFNVFLEPNKHITLFHYVPQQMLFPMFWVQQHVIVEESVRAELRMARAILDYGGGVCAAAAFVFALITALTTCCSQPKKKTKYLPPADLMYEKPKDEAELKLNPL